MHHTIPFPEDIQERKMPFFGASEKSKRLKFPNLRPLIGNSADISKINVGLNVNSAFSSKGFSFGDGLSAKIPLSTWLSGELRASYSRLTVGEEIEADTMHIRIRHTVGMISVPVLLNYTVSENFSVSLGVTPSKVITERRRETLQFYQWEPVSTSSADSTRRLVSERRESSYEDSVYKNNTYLGFARLSGRLSPSFLKKFNVVIEPYIAFPIGTLHSDQYNWTHGGVSLRGYLNKP
ncbi:hypothetical protein [Sphingobacterium faecale]|uniref:Outer membrane beta-barrel protein n=1 Tax=Sphingobacterium faecale TaxID=2803775 RepID=A0ABS1R1T3_9SPHI|nr:hypothetical protein [Sphingobacterium faecale]MBL1408007.1 hypothetical protein [Sphingobacterium faecale]